MDFSIAPNRESGKKERSGLLSFATDNVHQATPCFFLNTKCGVVPHLTPDVLAANQHDQMPSICCLPLNTILKQPGTDVMKKFDDSFQNFCGMKGFKMCCIQDLTETKKHVHKYNEEKSISVWTQAGRSKVDPTSFMDLIGAFKLNLVQCMSDVIPKDQTVKRCRKSVDRSLYFLDSCIAIKEQQKDVFQSCDLLGVVTGGDNETERTRSAVETARRPVQGIVFAGLDRLGDNMHALLKSSVEAIKDETRPLLMPGLLTPDDIVSAVRIGIDIFDTSYPTNASERGCALCFKFTVKRSPPRQELIFPSSQTDKETSVKEDIPPQHSESNDDKQISTSKYSDYEIDLHSRRYANDFSPLVSGCQCYSCRTFTRAYVNHLLVAKEMLAPVLLSIHNLYHFSGFFEALRDAVKNGTLDDLQMTISCVSM